MKKLLLITTILLIITTAAASLPDNHTTAKTATDKELYDLALKKGFISEPFNKDREYSEKNSIIIWIHANREKKIGAIDVVKDLYRQDGIIIAGDSDMYVDAMNDALYYTLNTGTLPKKGLKVLLETLAKRIDDFKEE